MRKTFEGISEVYHIVSPNEDWYPFDWLKQRLIENNGKTVRVSIEVEPVTLRSRVEKIFDETGVRPINTPITAANYCDLFFILRERVLAEIDAYAK